VEFSDSDHFTWLAIFGNERKVAHLGDGLLCSLVPLDWHRTERDRVFFAALSGRKMRIGFTVEEPEKVMGILKKKGQCIMREDGRG
jgi:hypothetical protein